MPLSLATWRQQYGSLQALVKSGLLLILWLTASPAQVITDIAPDGTLGTEVTQHDRVHQITGGMRPGEGPNLFHSFNRFHVGTGDTAHFMGQSGINNIIGRITGVDASMIDGRLQSDANLFLLNPSGFMFGPNATLNVNGSFHVSTADVLRFEDGAEFAVNISAKSTFTMAPPASFGFLTNNPEGMTIAGSTLQVSAGETLSVVGGDIEIRQNAALAASGRSSFEAGGQVHLASVASRGDVILRTSDSEQALDMRDVEHLGTIRLSRFALVEASGNGSGSIVVRGHRLILDHSTLSVNNFGSRDGAEIGIDIDVAEIVMNDSLLGARAFQQGAAGSITVDAHNVMLKNGASIFTVAAGDGQGGAVTVSATGTIALDGTNAAGTFPTTITANTQGRGVMAGAAGEVTVHARDIVLSNGAQISSLTSGTGSGGTVTVTATNTVLLDGISSNGEFPSGIGTTSEGMGAQAGDAGAIVVQARDVVLRDGAQVAGFTRDTGQGGTVTVTATNTVLLDGATADGRHASSISATSEGTRDQAGDAGSIVVRARDVVLRNGAQINSSTFGTSLGGTVTVTATNMVLLDGTTADGRFSSGIAAASQGTGAKTGDAGAVSVEAKDIVLLGGARISSSASGSGNGGTVKVTATETLRLTGTSFNGAFRTGITALAAGEEAQAGDAGSIEVRARHVVLSDGAVISSDTRSAGSGGNIIIGGAISEDGGVPEAVDTLMLDGNSRISANTGSGDGANITVGVRRMILDGGSEMTANTGAGGGGNIIIAGVITAEGDISARAGTLVLRGSQITANADLGRGGRIDIVAEAVLADPDSDITASSEAGIDGEVNIEALRTNLSEVVTPLSSRFAQDITLLRAQCAARLREGNVSSLVEHGREGVSTNPGGLLPRRLYRVSPDTIAPANPVTQTVQSPAVARNGLYRVGHEQYPTRQWATSTRLSHLQKWDCSQRW